MNNELKYYIKIKIKSKIYLGTVEYKKIKGNIYNEIGHHEYITINKDSHLSDKEIYLILRNNDINNPNCKYYIESFNKTFVYDVNKRKTELSEWIIKYK